MYPTDELKKLELRKLRIRLSILAHRQQCVAAGRDIQAAAATLDRWRHRIAQWGAMLKFAPGVFGIFQGLRGLMRKRGSTPGEAAPRKAGKIAATVGWIATALKAYNTFRR